MIASRSARPIRSQAVTTQLLPDGYVVIVKNESETAFTLPPGGAVVWEFCDGKTTIADIVNEVSGLEGVELSEGDIQLLLERLSEHDLVHW